MKHLIPAIGLISCLFSSFTVASPSGANAQTIEQAKRAFAGGDQSTAFSLIQKVLAQDPNNPEAKETLAQFKNPKKSLKQQIETVSVDQVRFKQVTLSEALAATTAIAEKNSGGSLHLNFVQQLPESFDQTKRFNLDLSNIPLSELLRYIGQLTNTQFVPETYAISVRPIDQP